MNVDISNTAAVYESWNDLIPRLQELQQLAQEVFCTELFHVTTKLISGVDDSEMALLPGSGEHTVCVTALRAQCKCLCIFHLFISLCARDTPFLVLCLSIPYSPSHSLSITLTLCLSFWSTLLTLCLMLSHTRPLE